MNKLLQRGITLVEMVITIVVLAISLVVISTSISLSMSRSGNTLLETQAVALAQSYLDEILGKRFDEESNPRGIPPCRYADCTDESLFGPEDGLEGRPDDGENSRIDFDDVDDYHGLDEGDGQTDPLLDAEGNEREGYENFRVRVSVRYLELDAAGAEELLSIYDDDLNDPRDAKLITVTISHRSNTEGWLFSVYKVNF